MRHLLNTDILGSLYDTVIAMLLPMKFRMNGYCAISVVSFGFEWLVQKGLWYYRAVRAMYCPA